MMVVVFFAKINLFWKCQIFLHCSQLGTSVCCQLIWLFKDVHEVLQRDIFDRRTLCSLSVKFMGLVVHMTSVCLRNYGMWNVNAYYTQSLAAAW